MELLTHSRASCFRGCPRRHEIRYEIGLYPEAQDPVLRVGSGFHAALEATDLGSDPGAVINAYAGDPFEVALIAAMYHGHALRYANEQLEVVATEMEFQLPLVNPDTRMPSRLWEFAGKIDRIVRLADGRLALMEYKTTSADFAPGSPYWTKLQLDQQLSLYVIAARTKGYDVSTILYDVTRRPGLRPLKATPVESRKYTKEGRLYAAQRDVDENPEEYAARVTESIVSDPDKHYARVEIPRMESDLEECQGELWTMQLAIREAQRSGRWWRNPGSCFAYSRPCEYLPICLNKDLGERTPTGYVRSETVHPELTGSATVAG